MKTHIPRGLWFVSVGLLPIFLVLQVALPTLAAPPAQLTPFPTPTPGPDGRILYIVQESDTLWRISAITGITLDQLRALNKLGEDATIRAGDVLLIGFAGPAEVTVTPGPSPTPAPLQPTPTIQVGSGILCVILYYDINGDGMRQESEPAIPGGKINVSDRSGTISFTEDSSAASEVCNIDPVTGYEMTTGYVGFIDLVEGEYNLTVAAPDGYNETTVLNRSTNLEAGETSYLNFGAQVSSVKAVETEIIPEIPGKSPLLGILGGLLLLVGLVLGIFAFFLSRRR